MHTIYILQSEADGNLYIGCTSHLEARVKEHNHGYVPSTKHRRPLKLIYYEQYEDKFEAYRKERYYKSAVGKRELKKKMYHSGIV